MNRTQKKKAANIMRGALEVESAILKGKGYLSGATAITEYLHTADDDSLVRFAEILLEAKTKMHADKRV